MQELKEPNGRWRQGVCVGGGRATSVLMNKIKWGRKRSGPGACLETWCGKRSEGRTMQTNDTQVASDVITQDEAGEQDTRGEL